MDHKWGRAVSELGLGGLGIKLASRWGVPASNQFVTDQAAPAGKFWLWQVPPDAGSPVIYSRVLFNKLAPHFPYGFAVEADGPV